ncbi:insulin-like receptor [Cylas formicarius]|uniref:insulin-like receptor n=1 Tax=Cylas formicarius TaxID=197179 RepID=UPI0029585E2B|nr:insulin-like receptor [Cylas formicarius]XP_060537021.1 insulin-like receptor [Cylas formicarius]XP_060537022.1 insulin-like receptor [Cylas formicarius]XP_060537023.1 insulin-like receptor [Cylas formicarius]
MALAALVRPLRPLTFLATFIFLMQLNLLNTNELISITPEPIICKSIDIRNKVESFAELEGCQVVEGYLQILLFDNVNETDLEKISFPELTEITDYLLLFRVNGLRSIGQLFPNLAIIRGQNLFPSNKALIVFEMSMLQEIGLYSLTDILRGSVHIDKNPSLCYVHTIDWNRIIHDKSIVPNLKSFKPENECPVCPESVNGMSCPRDTTGKDRYLCWNREHCQKICKGCDVCNEIGKCCDSHCMGGCSINDTRKCSVCRHYVGPQQPPVCVEQCPPQYYKYLDRRCVSKEECLSMSRPTGIRGPINDNGKNPYKIFNGSCILQCPTNYADDYERSTCKKCDNTCKKECPGASIDSINLAKQLRGCTHITSSLEIQIRGGNNVVKELEDNLSMIEEIDGYLKVVRSFSLVSLNFLRNLKRIGGKYLESQKYSLVVLDNQNLQDLWDWDNNRTIKIDNGSLFFHFNPMLCYSKIEELKTVAKLPDFTDLEVAPTSNGDKVACNVTELVVNVTKIESKGVILEWQPYRVIEDTRSLLSYTVFSIEAPNRTVNSYDGRDACGQDNWHVDDVPNNPNVDPVQHPLTNLKPYTQYAFYVRTYTVANEKRGAESKIQYFVTKPSRPGVPTLTVTSNSSDSLYAKWTAPRHPNGKITHYVLSGSKRKDLLLDIKRDYCKNPVVDYKPETPSPLPSTPSPKNDSCYDSGKQDRATIDEVEEWARIKFEDALHNEVYVKRTDVISRKRRHAYEDIETYGNSSQSSKIPAKFPNSTAYLQDGSKNEAPILNKTEIGSEIYETFTFNVVGQTEYYIKNLHHFTFYDVYIKACREKVDNDLEPECSLNDVETVPTLRKVGADNITNVTITNKSLETVTVSWHQPPDPNGKIVSILFHYKREGSKNAQPNKECISLKDFKKYNIGKSSMSYTITKLFPGNYSLCLKATSLAGDGEYSDCVNFVIEEPTSYGVLVTTIVLFSLFSIVVVVGCWFYRRNVKERKNMRLIPAVNPEYVASVYIPDEWEVSRKKIELIKELGQGSFGMVWEGIAHDVNGQSSIRCAVKTVNEHATNRERVDFLNEASVMKAFDTAHVVRLLGVVSQGQPTLVIMELMAHGDLKSYLRSHRPDAESLNSIIPKQPPSLKQILQMAIEIADGMAYLEAKKFVHRDLAARNCMVSEEMTVKIGDFGMTRDIYETDYYRKGTKGLLPVRWMAPESLKDGVFTSSSDVWSYGVVLWEMATLASQPYQGLSNDQVLRYVIDGGVMERPENCPDKLYALMRFCWQHKPTARPTFMKLCQILLEDASPVFSQVSFYHSPAGKEARSTRLPTSPCHNDNETEAATPLRRPPDRTTHGYTPSESQESDDIDIDTHHRFPSISEEPTANGYVGGRIRNGVVDSTQC